MELLGYLALVWTDSACQIGALKTACVLRVVPACCSVGMNKGGVGVGLRVGSTHIAFVGSHLAAHQSKTQQRNKGESQSHDVLAALSVCQHRQGCFQSIEVGGGITSGLAASLV